MAQLPAFQQHVLSWYGANRRDLPWRGTDDPYRILVAEVMLQQTQVPRVIPIYTSFLRRFPTAQRLAKAELGEVLQAWKGLGYNRRAKLLWECSKSLPYGKLPEDEQELRTLPGIGHYTAAAVLAFWANKDTVAIDTNVRRVHQRYFGRSEPEFVRSTLPRGKAREWNSALMDFGSLVCTRNPQCERCPLRRTCTAYRTKDFSVPVPKQAPFKESSRYYRGRIIDALRAGPKARQELLALGDHAKVRSALASLAKEGMVRDENDRYSLP